MKTLDLRLPWSVGADIDSPDEVVIRDRFGEVVADCGVLHRDRDVNETVAGAIVRAMNSGPREAWVRSERRAVEADADSAPNEELEAAAAILGRVIQRRGLEALGIYHPGGAL